MSRLVLVLTAAAAVLLTLVGGLLLAMYATWPLLADRLAAAAAPAGSDQGIASVAQWAVLGFFGLALGLALLWHVARDWSRRRSARFRVAPWVTALAVLAFPLVLLAGLTVLGWAATPKGYVFPLPHLLAILVPGLVALGLAEAAGRGCPVPALAISAGGLPGRDSRDNRYGEGLAQAVLGPPSWRRVLGALSWGITGGALIALVLEVLAVIAAVVVILLFLGLTGQRNAFAEWTQRLSAGQDLTRLMASSSTSELFSNPLVLAAVLFGVAVVVPIIEEGAKSLAVVLLRRRLATPRDAFLYGAAAGVGFGMFENIFYNTDTLSEWWMVAGLRFGAILMHALATGLIGLGWYTALRRRQWRRGCGLALLAFAVHGLWNGSQVVIIAFSTQWGTSSDLLAMLREGNPGGWLMLGWTAGLSLLAAVLLVVLPWRLAQAGRGEVPRVAAVRYRPAATPAAIERGQ